MRDDIAYRVLVNEEGQYSLWPADHAVPAGWRPDGTTGTEQECSAHVDEVWTDMRPRSLAEGTPGSAGGRRIRGRRGDRGGAGVR